MRRSSPLSSRPTVNETPAATARDASSVACGENDTRQDAIAHEGCNNSGAGLHGELRLRTDKPVEDHLGFFDVEGLTQRTVHLSKDSPRERLSSGSQVQVEDVQPRQSDLPANLLLRLHQ